MTRQRIASEWHKIVQFPSKRLMAYVVSGVTALVADNIVFLLCLYALHTPLALAVPAGLVTGLLLSFALNKKWTFKIDEAYSQSGKKQFTLYILLFIFNNIFTYIFIKTLFIFGIAPAISKIIATICVTLWNYLAYKRIIFR